MRLAEADLVDVPALQLARTGRERERREGELAPLAQRRFVDGADADEPARGCRGQDRGDGHPVLPPATPQRPGQGPPEHGR